MILRIMIGRWTFRLDHGSQDMIGAKRERETAGWPGTAKAPSRIRDGAFDR
jgi:hypothetical protein